MNLFAPLLLSVALAQAPAPATCIPETRTRAETRQHPRWHGVRSQGIHERKGWPSSCGCTAPAGWKYFADSVRAGRRVRDHRARARLARVDMGVDSRQLGARPRFSSAGHAAGAAAVRHRSGTHLAWRILRGASFSLALGISYGNIFRRVYAGAPGLMQPIAANGKPPIFISHGKADPTMPIDVTSRQFVPRLKRLGYDVTYREYEGRHQLPPEILREAIVWMTGTNKSPSAELTWCPPLGGPEGRRKPAATNFAARST